MKQVTVALGPRSYPIDIGTGVMARPEGYAVLGNRPRVLVTDRHVAPLHLSKVRAAAGLDESDCLVIPAGEAQKSWGKLYSNPRKGGQLSDKLG